MVRRILQAVLVVAAPSVAVYLVIIAATFIFYPRIDRSSVITSDGDGSFISDPHAYLVYASTAFKSPAPAVVFIGPSNVRMAFSPSISRPYLPGMNIHNTSLGGERIDDMAAVVRLFYAQRGDELLDDVVFVFGLWHGEFLYRESNVEDTLTVLQMTRFGLFKKAEKGHRVVLPRKLFDLAVDLLRPFFWLQGAIKANGDIAAWLQGEEAARPDFIQDRMCERSDLDALKRDELEPLKQVHPSQFIELVRVAKEINDRGGQLVIADLPQPNCFTQASKRWRDYQQMKLAHLKEASANGALYVNLQFLDDEVNFEDWTHPTPSGAKKISIELGKALRSAGLLGGGPASQ